MLHLTPPADFGGHPWNVQVLRASATGRYDGDPLFDAKAEAGTVVLREQQAGRYTVSVTDAAGNPYADEEFTATGAADETHSLNIEAVRIRGTVHRGDQPIAATIWFGTRFGDRHTAIKSDADGKFRGTLPHAGRWRTSVETETATTELHLDVPKKTDNDEA